MFDLDFFFHVGLFSYQWLEAGNIMDNLDFSEEEIQEQLALLGYKNIPKHRLREFKQG